MSTTAGEAVVVSILTGMGLDLPRAEIEHLTRTFQRQREAVRSWQQIVPPTTEPALVLTLPQTAAKS